MLNRSDKVYVSVILGLIFFILFKSCDHKQDMALLSKAKDSELRKEVLSNGELLATISSIEVSNEKQLIDIESKDNLIKQLKSEVKRAKGNLVAATSFSTVTTTNSVTNDVKISKLDTVIKDSTIYLYPEYTGTEITKWHNWSVIANKDSIICNYSSVDTFAIVNVTNKKNKGLLKFGRYSEVSIKSLNPDTDVTKVHSFVKKAKAKRFGVGPHVGIDINGNPSVGVSVNMSIIRF